MKKLLLLLLPLSSYANDFSQHKAFTLEAIEKREQILKAEKLCIKNSASMQMLKSCFVEAKNHRKEIDKDLRPKMPKN